MVSEHKNGVPDWSKERTGERRLEGIGPDKIITEFANGFEGANQRLVLPV
jgi:hypothetical protein